MTSQVRTYPEKTRFFTVSTAGHVDHGKTSLLKALTGIDPDRLKEEKERQMTTDLGFAFLELSGDSVVGFVDVPGHGKFLKNMLAGVGGIDMALLVVAADEGPMPQTKQHVRILSLIGVSKAVVALTKIDVVDDEEHLAMVRSEITEMLDKHGIEMLDLVPVSSTKLTGVKELSKVIETHLRALPKRDTNAAAFLPVDRVFTKAGFGTVVTGTLVQGKLAVGDQVIVGPDVSAGRIRRLETHGRQVEVAHAGQRLACNLVLKDNKPIARGHLVLAHDVPASKNLIVSFVDRPKVAGDDLSAKLKEQPIRLYHGTAEHHGYIRWSENIESSDDASTAVAFVALNQPALVQPGDRFLIRLSDETIFGGRILLRERPRWLNKKATRQVSQLLLEGKMDRALVDFVAAAPFGMIKGAQVSLLLPKPLDQRLVEQLVNESKELIVLSEYLMLAGTKTNLDYGLLQAVQALLAQQEEGETKGVSLETVRGALKPRIERNAFLLLVEQAVAAATIVRSGDKVSLPVAAGASAEMSAEDVELQKKITAILNETLCLEIDEIATRAGAPLTKVKSALHALTTAGQVHLINYEFAINDERLREAHKVLASIWQAKRNIAPTDFRESMQTTRKYAMALLQHFDDTKVTRRLPSGRVLLKSPV